MLHEHIDRHKNEEFLPENVFVIARCIQNSLICLSINEADYGSIYYWEWYWQYPWFEEFYGKKVDEISQKYSDVSTILSDTEHDLYLEVFNALNYATLVKVAGSFQEFLDSLTSEPESL